MYKEHAPVLFNAIKHHLVYLRQVISHTPFNISSYELRRLLLTIGAAQLDFYTGPLSINAIIREVKDFLHQEALLTPDSFITWIQEGKGYRTIHISDSSQWVLRPGHRPGMWVHLHPARYSPNTLRVKAHTLKTATALLIRNKASENRRKPALADTNQVREYLGLPPLAPRQLHQGLYALIELLAG